MYRRFITFKFYTDMNTQIKRGAVGGLMALTLLGATALPAAPARAATIAELQAQIQALLAQLTALQTQAGTMTCAAFTADLTIGRQGAEVTALQNFLIKKGYSIPAGATGYFGVQTQSALAAYQRAEGISPAAGYFGPVTRAKVNAQCLVAGTPTTPTNPGTGSGTPATPNPSLGGEAVFNRFDVKSGDDTSLEEGQRTASVLEATFDVAEGDARINRIELSFTPGSGNDEVDPWDTFSEVSLWNGDERIARLDTTNRRVWREDEPNDGQYLLRFSGLNWVVEEDDEVLLTVKATVANSVRGANDGELWDIAIPDEGIRALDADRVVLTTGDEADYVTIDIDRAGSTDELIIKRSDEDPKATMLELKDDGRSGFMPVFAFDLDTDDSRSDIEIRRIPVSVTVSSGTLNDYVRDARLVVDGTTFTRKTITDGTTGTITFEIDRGDLAIDGGDRVTAVLEIDFKELAPANEGVTLESSVSGSAITARGADSLSGSQLSGTASSEMHTLGTRGIAVALDSAASEIDRVDGAANDYATHRLTLEVTAIGQDVFIPTDANLAVTYQIENGSDVVLATGTSNAFVTSSGRKVGDYFRISEGDTETVTVEVVYQAGVAFTPARVQLLTLAYGPAAGAPTQTWNAVPQNDFESPVRTIVD